MTNQLYITAQLIDLICPLQKAIISNRVSQGIKNKILMRIIIYLNACRYSKAIKIMDLPK